MADEPTPNSPAADVDPMLILSPVLDQIREVIAATEQSRKQAETLLQEVQSRAAEISSAARDALATKTAITDLQAVIATKSQHIQDAQEHADRVRGDLDRTLTAAIQQATDAEGQKARAESAAIAATNALGEFKTAKATLDEDATAAHRARQAAEKAEEVTRGLAEKAASLEQTIADRLARLKEIEAQSVAQMELIHSHLPEATASGLAAAFDERRRSFRGPYLVWQVVFVLSILAIVALTVSSLWHTIKTDEVPQWNELIRLWITRLPVVGALVWLALHASHESGLAKRLEEDYGYKVAVSRSLEGFKKQMSDVRDIATPESPLGKLLSNTLETMAAPPGRIYDKHELSASLSKETARIAKASAEAATAAKKSSGPTAGA